MRAPWWLFVWLTACAGDPTPLSEDGDTGAVESDTDTDTDADTDTDTDADTDTDTALFTFYSPDFSDGSAIPAVFTCAGPGGWSAQHNPDLVWENAPAGTAAFAMIYVDIDLGDWRHWAFFTSDATVTAIAEDTSNTGSLPAGVTELRSGDNRTGYVPNCPGGEQHRYEFTLYALSTANLGLSGNPSFADLRTAAEANALATASFIGLSDASP